jgi:hypothetical protein
MNDQLPAVEIVEDPNTVVTGAAIRNPGHDPIFCIPFPNGGLEAGDALNESEVLLIAEADVPPGQLVIAKVDAFSGKATQRTSINGSRFTYLLSRDRRYLYAVGGYPHGLLMINAQSLTVCQAYNVALMSGDYGRLVKTSEYFTIDPTIGDRDARVFHSEELRAEYEAPEVSRLFIKPLGRMEEIGVGKLRLSIEAVVPPVDVDFLAGTLNYCQASDRIPSELPSQKKPTAPDIRDAFSAFVRQSTFVRIVVDDWTAAACARGLNEQEKRIANDYEKIIVGRTFIAEFLNFDYVVAGQTYSEEAFFQRILDRDVDVVAPLRKLLVTYLGKIEAGHHPWQSGVGPALCSGMRALILLDPESLDLLRLFLTKRDMEHENYCYRRIVTEFGERYGW